MNNVISRERLECFWATGCSDSARCCEFGSCVAAHQNKHKLVGLLMECVDEMEESIQNEGKLASFQALIDKIKAALTGNGSGWIPVSERLPDWHKPVALLDINRFQNCHFDLNIHDAGYLEGEAPRFYWAIRGERAQEIHAFTHWTYLPPSPNSPAGGEGRE
jgi:hypothetical protein